MEKVVVHGQKIDLHIHSCASSAKDGRKVKHNTIDNIQTLIDKLNENGVNMCAITDHDTFSFTMYQALKAAERMDNSINKVLPGVEFSVRFLGDNGVESVVHVIAIFSDAEVEKVKRIENVLSDNRPDSEGSYPEDEFLKILRIIELDTILIAHQKNTLSSKTIRQNDVKALGVKRFYELVYSDYFEALEFKNRRNEILNKSFLVENGLEDSIRFVTGTDCHDWSVYPREDPSDNTESFPYTYAKCLPTFRGLVMAVTDHFRLKHIDSFFNADKFTLDQITLKSRSRAISVPLSKGINVIIGDNSVGKSMLLHALTGFEKDGEKLPQRVKAGYKAYISSCGLSIPKQLARENIFYFDMQGEVRSKFEENKLNTSDFLSKNFPGDVNPGPYKAIVEAEIDRLIRYLTLKFALDAEIRKLHTFGIPSEESQSESLIFEKNLRRTKVKVEPFATIIEAIDRLLFDYSRLLDLGISPQERTELNAHCLALEEMKRRYKILIQEAEANNWRIEIVAKAIEKVSARHSRSISDTQKRAAAFSDNTESLIQSIVEIQNKSQQLGRYIPHIQETRVIPNSNLVHEYEFISKLQIDSIDTEYFLTCLGRVMKSGRQIDWSVITEEGLKDSLLRYDANEPCLQFFRAALMAEIEPDFTPKHTIINQGMDKSNELSAGMDAKIYFDILSYESRRDGLYIIDQPEDNVSQMAIKTYLLSCFKTMGENRQVIIVTHNPQFIVNLDVDNLIFISKVNGAVTVQSGALEYECPEYKILDIVADNIDGGLDSIQKRWKRYEKVNRF